MTVEKARATIQAVLAHAMGTRVPVRATRLTSSGVELRIDAGKASHRLVAHWLRGWPSDVSALLSRLGRPWPRDHVALAPRFSPGAVALLDRAEANWAENTGRARIRTTDGLVIGTTGRPARSSADEPGTDFRWSPGRADVAEVLLATRDVPRLEEIRRLTGWSVPQIGQTLVRFDSQGWTARRGTERGPAAARALVGWEPLLESWAAYVAGQPRQGVAAHATYQDPLRYLAGTLRSGFGDLRWAASGWAGLQLTRPFVTTVPRIQVYVDSEQFHSHLPLLMTKAGLREVTEGARVEMWPARPAYFVQAIAHKGVPVVHAARLYADLLPLGDRGREAALHIREEVLDRA